MKKVYLLNFLLVFFLLFTFFASNKNAFACDGSCGNKCTGTCYDCPQCLPIPTYNPPSQGINNPILPSRVNDYGATFLQKAITLVIELLFVGGIIIFFIMLLSGGVRWIASGGDKTHLEGAKGQITHALIGLVVLFSAFAIIKLIGALFGIDLLKLSLPTL